MSLDLGALVGSVVLDTAPFDRAYARVVRQFSSLGAQAERAAAGTTTLDRGLASTAASADGASAAMAKAQRTTATAAAAEEKAAAAAMRHSEAVARVAAVSNPAIATTDRLRAAQLRQIAAQERVDELMAGGAASTRQLAAANAALVTSSRSVAAAQAVASRSSSRFSSALAGNARMILGLGATFGVFELIKKGIDVSKEANGFQRDMALVQTNADVTAAEVNRASSALLKMAGPVAAAPHDLAVAFYHAKSVGLDYSKALQTTRIAAEGARVGHADLEQTMNALTSTVASGIPGVKNMAGAMGQLIATVGSGDMKLADLNQALGSGILTVVKGYGLSLRDVGAALATFGDNNIRGADAATMLRMAVQAMAVPAKAGTKQLRDLGLSTTDLARDMQTGGLMKAVRDLKAHLDAAGISSVQVGQVLTTIFGKRAGPGLQVLIGQTDRLEQKFAVLGDASSNFGAKWKATTGVAAVALARLGHGLEAAAIAAVIKLSPAIAEASSWLGQKLPAALHTVAAILTPFAHDVGSVLGPALRAVAITLGIAAAALAAVGRVAQSMSGALGHVATEALAVYAAFKVVGLSVAIFKGVQAALLLTRIRVGELATGYRALAAAETLAGVGALSAVTGVRSLAAAGGAAAAAAAKAATAFAIFRFAALASVGANRDQLDALKQTTAQYQYATHSTDMSAKAFIRWAATAKHETLPVRDVVKALGITADQLAAGISGSDAAFKKWTGTLKENGNVLGVGTQVLNKLHAAFKNTDASAAKASSSTKHLSAAQREAAASAAAEVAHQKRVAAAEQAAQVAAQRLDDALKALSGQLGATEALDQYRSSLQGLKQQLDEHNHSLAGNSRAAVQNRLALDGVIHNALQYADALKEQGRTQPQIAAAMRTQIGALIANARQYGLNESQVRKYLRTLGLTPAQIATTMLTKTEQAQLAIRTLQAKINAVRQGKVPGLTANNAAGKARIAELQRQIDSLQQRYLPSVGVRDNASGQLQHIANLLANLHDRTVTVTTQNRGISVGGRASGGGLPMGWAAVGERGAELAYTSASGTHIYSNSQSKAIIAATGMRAPGFAGGTGTPPVQTSMTGAGSTGAITTAHVSGKKVWVYKGQRYASERAALNARSRDEKKADRAGIVDTAVLPGVKGIANVIAGQTGPAARAMRLLSRAVTDAFQLKGIEKSIASVKQRLTDMKSYRSDVMGTLASATDTTKAGSVTDLLATLKGGTAANTSYSAELTKLRHEAKGNKTLTGYINQLAAQGNTTTLDTLSHASKSDLNLVSKQVGSYNASLLAGGNAAVVTKYGTSISAETRREKRLEAERRTEVHNIDKLLHAIALITGRPAEIKINGKTIASEVVHPEVIKILDELGNHLTYRRPARKK